MSTSETRKRAQRIRRRPARRSHRWSWFLGGLLVSLGALSGAFGTVAWLTVLCVPSFPRVLLGVLSLGIAPVVGGGAMLWAGLSMLEAHAARGRVWSLPVSHLLEAARGGQTAPTLALKLGVGDVKELTARLDQLVARDVLALDVSEEGELVYRPRLVS